jgi:hypothetical protein
MPRKQHSIFYIYKITCNVTGRYYIGMHSTSNLEDGYFGSGKRLKYSVIKYGKENHSKEILEFLENTESLINRETQLVNADLLKDPNCMNLAHGGIGGFISLEGCKLGSSNRALILWKNSEYQKQQKNLASVRLKEKWKDPEYRTNMLDVSTNSFKNKQHTLNSKLLMSNKAKLRIGKLSSSFDTCWIYHLHLQQSIKIKNEQLNTYLEQGWIKGRKLLFK